MTRLILFKSQIPGYTRSDGTYVKPHANKVVAKPKQMSMMDHFKAQHAKKAATSPASTKPKPVPKAFHTKPNDVGEPVALYHPHAASDAANWTAPEQQATCTPGSASPPTINGVPFKPWKDGRPKTASDWNAVAGQMPDLDEPPMPAVDKGKHLAAGVVVEEADGRVWTISPSNRFGGYDATFPKGTIEDGINPQASAIKEAFEESGLQVEITGFLADVKRSTSATRYYRAKRVGGDPSDMGWESQSVHLIPRAALEKHLANKYDQPLVAALTKEI